LPPQLSRRVQVPHDAITPPQPSGYGPQFTPAGHFVAGMQLGRPHCEETPAPPHVAGAVQLGHVTVPPQPSPTVPH
jgi:hypothetical protein